MNWIDFDSWKEMKAMHERKELQAFLHLSQVQLKTHSIHSKWMKMFTSIYWRLSCERDKW